MTEREIFAQNLKYLVNKSYMNQAQVAEKLGVSRGTFSDYLNGKAYPRPEKMRRLSEILGVSQIDLTSDGQPLDGESNFNSEILKIAKDIFENPDARALYSSIRKLETVEIEAFRTLIMMMNGK